MITENNNKEDWEDANFEEIIEKNNINNLLNDIENSSESIKVDFKQEDVDDEILSLTEYVNPESNNNISVISEYNDISVININNSSKKIASDLVKKITNFIISFDDVELNKEHKNYLKEVGNLEIATLEDLLTITNYNKQMIDNIVLRINSVQAEDYAMIQSFTSLVNNHMKLMKDLQSKYKAIPSVIKRMKAEIMCNQELGKDETDYKKLQEEVEQTTEIASNKELLKRLREKREKELNNNNS